MNHFWSTINDQKHRTDLSSIALALMLSTGLSEVAHVILMADERFDPINRAESRKLRPFEIAFAQLRRGLCGWNPILPGGVAEMCGRIHLAFKFVLPPTSR